MSETVAWFLVPIGAVVIVYLGVITVLHSPRHEHSADRWTRGISLVVLAIVAVLATPWALYFLGKAIGRDGAAVAIVAATVVAFLLLWWSQRGSSSSSVG